MRLRANHAGASAAAIALVLLVSPSVHAQDGRADQDDHAVVFRGAAKVPEGRTIDSIVVFQGPTRVDGTVIHDVVALRGDVYVKGTVGGDVVALGGVPHLASSAHVDGDVVSSKPAMIARGAHVSGAVRAVGAHGAAWGGWVVYLLTWLGMTISAGLLALLLGWLVPARASDALYRTARSDPGVSLGVGVLIAIVLPVLAIAAMLTIVGIPLGVAVLFALVLLAFAGFVASGWVLGRAITHRRARATREETWGTRIGDVLLGVAILSAVSLIPVIGNLIWIGASFLGIGAAALAAYRARRKPLGPPAERAPREPEPRTFEPPPYPEERPAGA